MLYRISLPLLGTQVGTADELVAFSDALARWIDAIDLQLGDRGVLAFLDWAALALTCERVGNMRAA